MSWGFGDDLLGSSPNTSEPSPATPHAHADEQTGAEAPLRVYDRRTARREGREVARLRCVWAGSAFVVECEVFPVNAMRATPILPGPYLFESLKEAKAFLWEVARALEYLGCYVADPDAEDVGDAEAA
jgi:hypothetical protein